MERTTSRQTSKACCFSVRNLLETSLFSEKNRYISLKRFIYFHCIYVSVLLACMEVHDKYAVSVEARIGHQIIWNYRGLLATMGVLIT